MTLQQAFNRMYAHFILKKNGPCRQNDNQNKSYCAYQNDKGDRCAIGILLPRDLVWQRNEDVLLPLYDLILHYPEAQQLFLKVDLAKLEQLQRFHDINSKLDNKEFYKKMKSRLDEFAFRNKLTRPKVSELKK